MAVELGASEFPVTKGTRSIDSQLAHCFTTGRKSVDLGSGLCFSKLLDGVT